jgi:hypothetical protein
MNDAAAAQPPGLNTFMGRMMEWITGKDARLAQLETEAASLATIRTQLANATQLLEAANVRIGELEKGNQTLTKENVALAERIAQTEADVDRRANVLAGQRLATIGVKPIKEELNKDAQNQGSLVDQWRTEQNPAKREALYQRIKTELWQTN